MERSHQTKSPHKHALIIATVIAISFGAYFLRHYTTLIIFAAILAFLFNPYYQRRYAKNKNPGRASAQTFLFALVVILIPLLLLIILTSFQISHSVKTVSDTVNSVGPTTYTQHQIDQINNLLAKTPTSFRVTPEWIHQEVANLIQKVGTAMLNNFKTYLGSFFNFFTTAIIFIFVFLSLLRNQKTLLEVIRRLNPLGEDTSDLYMERVSAMTKAMVRGQFIIALAQGFTDAALIYIGGFHDAFFFLLMILIALSFIPLGGGILAIPIGVIMILTGNVAGGLLVIIGHLIIVTNIDNILRPRLVPPEAKLDSALTILSVFSGLALFGFLGIVVGPVIMIIIVTTISVYLSVFENMELETAEEETLPSKNFWHRVLHLK